jgi:insulin receptor
LCGGRCLRKCKSKIIDSISTIQSLKGCNIIEGNLEIQLKASVKSIVKELDASLSEIEEITGFLKIVRSYSIISLNFLRNLKKIHGSTLDQQKFSVYVWDNYNLQALFNEGQKIEILNGKVLFYLNPKLCYNLITNLVGNDSMIEDIEATKKANGDKNPCTVTEMEVKVDKLSWNHAVLEWKQLQLKDERKLLNYVVYYMPTNDNVTIWESREACGNDGFVIIRLNDDVNDFSTEETVSYPLLHLNPFTRYAFYVQAFTLQTENINALSKIQYFRTLPGKPQPLAALKFKVTPLNSSSFVRNNFIYNFTL